MQIEKWKKIFAPPMLPYRERKAFKNRPYKALVVKSLTNKETIIRLDLYGQLL